MLGMVAAVEKGNHTEALSQDCGKPQQAKPNLNYIYICIKNKK